jgi:hypothetical protein
MDERKPPIPSRERDPQPASRRTPTVVDSFSADLATSSGLVAPGWARHADQSELCQTDLPDGPSAVVFCGDEEKVSRGFLIALRAMGVAVVEQTPKPEKPPVARAKS